MSTERSAAMRSDDALIDAVWRSRDDGATPTEINDLIAETLWKWSNEQYRKEQEQASLRQVDPDHNPDYVMGPGDDVPRLGTVEELRQLGVKP